MNRWPSRLLIVASALPLVAVAAGWATHRRGYDAVLWSSASRSYLATVRPLGLYLATGRLVGPNPSPGWAREHADTDGPSFPPRPLGFRWGQFQAGGPPAAMSYVVVPYWPLGTAAVALPVVVAVSVRRRRRTPMAGRCRRCGYDLRATPGRCPECGAVPA